MNEYLIPANTKKSQLIFNVFRPIDLAILTTGFFVSVILLILVEGNGVTQTTIKLLPVAISGLLVMPVPFYHNVLVFLREVYIYLVNPTRYKWRGWCASYVTEDDAKQKESKY